MSNPAIASLYSIWSIGIFLASEKVKCLNKKVVHNTMCPYPLKQQRRLFLREPIQHIAPPLHMEHQHRESPLIVVIFGFLVLLSCHSYQPLFKFQHFFNGPFVTKGSFLLCASSLRNNLFSNSPPFNTGGFPSKTYTGLMLFSTILMVR